MNDENKTTKAVEPTELAASDDPKPRTIQYRTVDEVLRGIAFLANVAALQIPITVTVGGLVVSGYVIGFDTYMGMLRQEFTDFVSIFDEKDRDFVQEMLNKAVLAPPPSDDSPLISYDDVHFLNLRGARFFGILSGQPVPTNKGLLWRCPLETIDSFSVGALTIETPKD